jgi:hypothetical protein
MKNTLKRLEEFEKELFKEDFRRLSKRNQMRLQMKYLNIMNDSMKEYRKAGIKLLKLKEIKASAATIIFLVGEKF